MTSRACAVVVLCILSVSSQPTIDTLVGVPTIDPPLLFYLGNHLNSSECHALCKFLATHSNSPTFSTKLLNCSKKLQQKEFVCVEMLKKWNEQILSSILQDSMDADTYGRNLLQIGLRKSANRLDLEKWIENLTLEQRRTKVVELNRSIRQHHHQQNRTKNEVNNSGFNFLPDPRIAEYLSEAEVYNGAAFYYLQILIGSCVLILVAVGIYIVIGSSRRWNEKTIKMSSFPNKKSSKVKVIETRFRSRSRSRSLGQNEDEEASHRLLDESSDGDFSELT